jgi:HEAT repeat protein
LLHAAIHDPAYTVRRAALSSVIRLKPDDLASLLEPFIAMQTPGERTKPLAIAALARISGDSFVPQLLALSHAANDRVRRTALQGFSIAGRNQKVVLDRLLDALHDDDKVDRLTAIQVLAVRKDPEAVEQIRQVIATEELPDVVRAAKSALETITAPQSAVQ